MVGATRLSVHEADIVRVLVHYFSWRFLANYLTEGAVGVGDITGTDPCAERRAGQSDLLNVRHCWSICFTTFSHDLVMIVIVWNRKSTKLEWYMYVHGRDRDCRSCDSTSKKATKEPCMLSTYLFLAS